MCETERGGSTVTVEFAASLTDGEVHCAAMGGLAGRFVENKEQKYEI